MNRILPVESPIAINAFAARVRSSSNFNFAWQWLSCQPHCSASPANARAILDAVVQSPEAHRFLRESFTEDPRSFSIEPLHEHCNFGLASDVFEQTLARGAADCLGAYSRNLRDATPAQAQEVKDLFGAVGTYSAFELCRGQAAGCSVCAQYDSHLFTSWFYGVAWDWCFCLIWEARSLAWVGCLTDTD